MPTPTPQLTLTEHQQWALTISQEIEAMGWIGAAHALRRKHFPHLPWDSLDKTFGGTTDRGFRAMLRAHHGSCPPLSDFAPLPPKKPVHHGMPPAPRAIDPEPRPDQPTA